MIHGSSLYSATYCRRPVSGDNNSSYRVIVLSMSLLMIIFLLASTPLDASQSNTIIKGGQSYERVTVKFPPGGGYDASLSIPLQRGGPVISGSLSLSTVEGSRGPDMVAIDVGMDGRSEWSFGGGSRGGFGRQNSFISGNTVSRVLIGDDDNNVSFLLPEGAIISNSTVGVSSPPTPELTDPVSIYSGSGMLADVGELEVVDMDGDGIEEIFYHSRSDSSIYMLFEDNTGNLIRKKILAGVSDDPHMGRIYPNPEQIGGLIIQYSNGSAAGGSISFFTGNPESGPEETVLARNLSPAMVGFSIANMGSGTSSRIMVARDGGTGVSVISFDASGSHTRQLVVDNTSAVSGMGAADLDGNGRADLILFPDSEDGNITIHLSGITDDPNSRTVIDTGSNSTISGSGVSVDINGDGYDEYYFPGGPDGDLGVISRDTDGEYRFEWAGIDETDVTPWTLERDIYGDSEVFRGKEGFLMIGSPNGLRHLLPESTPLGDHLKMVVSDDSGPAAIGNLSFSGEGYFYQIVKSRGIVRSSISWSETSGVNLWKGSDKISTGHTPNVIIDISSLIGPVISGNEIEDASGNRFQRLDIRVEALSGFVSLRDLSIKYDITMEASRSSTFLASLDRAFRDLGGSSIPFMVVSDSAGSVEVGPASVTYDSPPVFLDTLPGEIHIKEGSMGQTLINTRDHVSDDLLDRSDLKVTIHSSTPAPDGMIFTDRNGNVISHASVSPDFNGKLSFRLSVSDGFSRTISPEIDLVVEPVQDLPVLISDPGEIYAIEGEKASLLLAGHGGIFHDPDGDPLHFEHRIVVSDPVSMKDHVSINIADDTLEIIPATTGSGGTGLLEIRAMDENTALSDAATVMIPFTVENVDQPPEIRSNPGPLIMSEDQDTPTKVPLEGWIYDPDTPINDFTLISYSSDPRLVTDFYLEGSRPFMLITPTSDLTGREMIWIELVHDDLTLTDRVEVEIEPVNDLPEVSIINVDYQKGVGWIVSGSVLDPDDNGGRIEYRVGTGEWRDAWGFRSWSFLVEERIVPGSGSYVFVRADDSNDLSAVVFTKVLWPYDPPDPEEPVFDDDEPEGPGDSPELPADSLTPDDPGSSGPPWYIAGGLWGIIIGGLIFLIWTETGFVTVVTGIMSIYSKLSKKDILNHEIRGLIRGYIIANPGDHYSSIKRNLDLNNGTLAYHLRVLEQNGFIKSMYDGIYKRYYPANININKLKKNVSKQEEIFNIILDNPGITMEQIGRAIGVSRQVVNYHVKNLIRARVVTYTRDSKSARFYPSDSSGQFDQT